MLKNRMKLGICYFAEPADSTPGAGNPNNDNPATDDGKGTKDDAGAKFTQDDINKAISDRLANEKAKHEREMSELKAQMEREAELAKMSEDKRIKAELEDYKKKFKEEADKNALAIQSETTRKLLEEAKVPTSFLKFVLVPKDEKQTQINISELKTVFEAEIKKGIEAQIKTHVPKNNGFSSTDQTKRDPRSYSGFNLQNSVAEYYRNKGE